MKNAPLDIESMKRGHLEIELLGETIATQAAHLDAATHRLLTDLRTFDQAAGWFRQGARSCAAWLCWRVGWDGRTARDRVRVANRLGELPLVDDALRRGELSYSKVRAIARAAATPQLEATLLEYARQLTGAQLEKVCRMYISVANQDSDAKPSDDLQRRSLRWRELEDGMVRFEGTFHPEDAALIKEAIERIAAEQCRQRSNGSAEPLGVGTSRGSAEPSADTDPIAEVVLTTGVGTSRGSAEPHVSDDLADRDDEDDEYPTNDEAVGRGAGGTNATAGPTSATMQVDGRELAPEQRQAQVQRSFDRAGALVSIAQEIVRGRAKQRSPINLVLTSTLEALIRPAEPIPSARVGDLRRVVAASAVADVTSVGVLPGGCCISAAATRRLACDCAVTRVLEDERGNPLSIGRKARTIPGAMKAAVLRLDKTCKFPGCNAIAFLEGHHAVHWADGGETSVDNIMCLCGWHHRFVHEYEFEITMDADRVVTVIDPLGRKITDVPARQLGPVVGLPMIQAANANLGIAAETPFCGWNGEPIDYPACVGGLLAADPSSSARR